MKSLKYLAALAALSLAAVGARAQTLDLLVGFGQSGAANDVLIDFGSVSNYSAPAVYNLGNYASVLSTNFTDWNTSTGATAVQFGAFATSTTNGGLGKANPIWITSSWDTSTAGTLGAANSANFAGTVASQINGGRVSIGNMDNGYGTFTLAGVAKTVSSSSIQSYTKNSLTAPALQSFDAAQLNTGVTDLANNGTANFAAADIYQVSFGTPGAGLNQSFLGTLAVFQNGDVFLYTTLAPIPEPATYAGLLGVVTLGIVAIRRRRQMALEV